MIQGRNHGVQSAEADDLTVWIIYFVRTHDYVIYLALRSLLSNIFCCKLWEREFGELDKY